jgi:hypothetical protein
MVRAPHADPRDAGLFRHRDRFARGARHHEMAHAVVAVDERGRRRALRQRDVGVFVEAARLQPADILRQPENAVAVGAGEIGLGHQFGACGGVGFGQTGRNKRILDQRLR